MCCSHMEYEIAHPIINDITLAVIITLLQVVTTPLKGRYINLIIFLTFTPPESAPSGQFWGIYALTGGVRVNEFSIGLYRITRAIVYYW